MNKRTDILELKEMESRYGSRQVLAGIGFRMTSGEVSALIGPNGSGKTTLLRAVAGLQPATGTVILDGAEDLTRRKPEERARWIGFLSASPVIPPDMTAAELTETGFHPELGLFEETTEEQKRKTRECLDELGMLWAADRPMRTLSGGQRQLVLLARATVRKPRILLLDEPDTALDFSTARDIAVYLRELAKVTGCGVLMTSHDVNLMLRYADRILMLKDGRTVADVRPDLENPDSMEKGLRALYGPVTLIRHGKSWMMAEKMP